MSADTSPCDYSARMSYAWHSRNREPDTLVVRAFSSVEQPDGIACDVGAGSLGASRYLLSAGMTVDAVDVDPYTLELAAEIDDPRLHAQCADIRDVPIPAGRYDLIVAIKMAHLLGRSDLEAVLRKLAGGLSHGGILGATFLGERDSWAVTPRRATVVRWDVLRNLTPDLEVLWRDELEYDGASIDGEAKHWHTLSCLLRKPLLDRVIR